MLNILVTGSNGQLGSEIKEISLNYSYNFLFTDRANIDLTNKENIRDFCQSSSINVIINCAAYTAVDKAEEDKISADKINHLAVKNLAQIAKDDNIKLIHISTDYVFDGKNYKPYKEDDKVNPNSVYGQTKLNGEKVMQEISPDNSIIIRTSWVYSSFGNNFVKTMLRLGKEKGELGVIFDQLGAPTYANDLAKAILDILLKVNNKKVELYHYSNEGVLSWYDFAKEIMKMAKINCVVNPIETKDYPTSASRPYYSLLNKSKIKQEFNVSIPYWKDSLEKCLNKLGERE
jgi:dTDP-4-dehydrorhamnose reductase